jgi:hypothetical protein
LLSEKGNAQHLFVGMAAIKVSEILHSYRDFRGTKKKRQRAVPVYGHGGNTVSEIFHSYRDCLRHFCDPPP